jgi:hypothetical protein
MGISEVGYSPEAFRLPLWWVGLLRENDVAMAGYLVERDRHIAGCDLRDLVGRRLGQDLSPHHSAKYLNSPTARAERSLRRPNARRMPALEL